jgi:hypothetical protein
MTEAEQIVAFLHKAARYALEDESISSSNARAVARIYMIIADVIQKGEYK